MIAATNRNLEEEVAKGRFRSDLFYRLNVLPIALPGLRTHSQDVPLLVEYFIDGFNAEFRKKGAGREPGCLYAASALRLAGQRPRTAKRCRTRDVALGWRSSRSWGFAALGGAGTSTDEFELPANGVDLDQLERSLVIQALKRAAGNQTRAAALLGLNRDQIRYRIEKFGLSPVPSAQ